ncbi:hypothetical protein EJB05_24469, partial [Eragrostis curvula]
MFVDFTSSPISSAEQIQSTDRDQMAGLFSKQAAVYMDLPQGPLAALTPHHRLAWDVGTGSGQAAIGVSIYAFCEPVRAFLYKACAEVGIWQASDTVRTARACRWRSTTTAWWPRTYVSAEQLRHAAAHPKVRYLHTPGVGEEDLVAALGGGEGRVDLVTVAAAAHWFDLPAFYGVARRVLRRPGGVIAVWGYKPTTTA